VPLGPYEITALALDAGGEPVAEPASVEVDVTSPGVLVEAMVTIEHYTVITGLGELCGAGDPCSDPSHVCVPEGYCSPVCAHSDPVDGPPFGGWMVCKDHYQPAGGFVRCDVHTRDFDDGPQDWTCTIQCGDGEPDHVCPHGLTCDGATCVRP
jgi:hypothetical protein